MSGADRKTLWRSDMQPPNPVPWVGFAHRRQPTPVGVAHPTDTPKSAHATL
jgi:hypothetical protein